MIGNLRLVLALAACAAVTLLLLPYQVAALNTDLLDERRVPRLWHRIAKRLLGFRIHVKGEISRQKPLLLVANHVSWTDIVVLGSLANVHFIAKSEVAGWPIFGLLAKLQRSVFVDRAARRTSGAQANQIAERLNDGDLLVLFAEGTTSDGTMLLPFNSTLFGAAEIVRKASPDGIATVQPVAIVYTRRHGIPAGRNGRRQLAWIGDEELFPHLLALVKEGAVDVEVHFGEPMSFGPADRRKEIARESERRVRDMMAAALRNPQRSRP